jgi:hypothetical protein
MPRAAPRGAGCRIMAENDCTPHEIAAVSGHRTLKEVERYTHAADRKRLAARAQAKVAAACNVVPLAVVGRWISRGQSVPTAIGGDTERRIPK